MFYLITVIFSWICFFVTDAWLIPKYAHSGFIMLIAFYGHMAAMMGPMLGGIIMLKLFHKEKLLEIKWSSTKYYVYTIYGVLVIWIVPALILLLFNGDKSLKTLYSNYDVLFIISYLLFGWFAGMGEEYGWSGYILNELSGKIGKSKAVVASGILRGLWHLPVLIIPVMLKFMNGEKTIIELSITAIVVAFQLFISNIFMSALFGFVWYKTSSIPLIGWMHFLFDFGRDLAIFFVIGFAGSWWFKLGWGFPFYFFAYLACDKIAKEDGYSNIVEIFYRKKKTVSL